MDLESLKQKVRTILGDQVVFNKEFDEIADNVKNFEENILPWCTALKDGLIKAVPSSYLNGSLVFINRIGSSNRCVVIKVKNGVFCEFHLGDHRYYDYLRKKLGIKEGSRMY